MLPAVLLTVAALGAPSTDADLRRRAEALVAQLGDPSYREREEAARELLAIGYAARDAVLAGQKSADSEVRDRCRKLYPLIWRANLETQVKRFVEGADRRAPTDLPGVARWIGIAGDGKASRELYATMLLAHPDRLVDVALHPRRLDEVYLDLVKTVYQRAAGRPVVGGGATERLPPTEDEVLLFLFLGAVGDVRPTRQPGTSSSYYYQFLNAPATTERLTADPPDVPFRRLYAGWLAKERYSLVLRRGIDLAARNDIRECAPAILDIAKDVGTPITTRATALIGFGRLGTREDLKKLEPFVKDEVRVATTIINGVRSTVEMRDIALGAAVQLVGEDLSDFGFERKIPAGLTSVSYTYFAFSTDEKRAAAHAKWTEWVKENLKE